MTFKDLFSTHSAAYAAHRPTYPAALVDWLAAQCPARDAALDVGCGSGQLSALLADRFRSVIADRCERSATGASREARQRRLPRRSRRAYGGRGPLRRSRHRRASRALVRPARLLCRGKARRPQGCGPRAHHLQRRDHRRGDRPGGEAFLQARGGSLLGTRSPACRGGLPQLRLSLRGTGAAAVCDRSDMARAEVFAYVDTWSAVRGLEKAHGRAPVEEFHRDLQAAWGDPERARVVRFPLSMRVGRM